MIDKQLFFEKLGPFAGPVHKEGDYETPKSERIYRAGDEKKSLLFRQAELTDEEIAALEAEIAGWAVADEYEWSYEDLVYEDESKGSGTKLIPLGELESLTSGSHLSSATRGGILLKKGKFIGAVLDLEDTSSYGMAYSHERFFSALLTDGTKLGKTSYHYSHCSTEKDESSSSDYSLVRTDVRADG